MSGSGYRLRCLAASGAVLLAVGAVCAHRPIESPEWRQQQEPEIVEAIIADLVEMPPDRHDPTDIRSCACVFAHLDRAGYRDPSAAVVAALRARGIDAYPISACGRWVVSATGRPAVFLGVVSIEWRSDDLVVAEGERLLGILAGNTWRYTLSRSDGRWHVDTVRVDKII